MTRRLAALALAGLALAACGKKGPPVPPEGRLPRPVMDLTGSVADGAIELQWTNPGRRADNTRLRDLAAARLYRVEDPGDGEPKPALLRRGTIAGYEERASVPLALPPGTTRPAAVVVEGDRVRFQDQQGLTYGRRYTYVVVTEDAQGRVSPPSPRVSIAFIAPPEPPIGVSALAGENQVRLAWRPPARLIDGSPVEAPLAYEVLRAPAADAPAEVITPVPLETTVLTDGNLENDRTYYYAVRAVREETGTVARGQASARVAATPRDMTPPSPPADLVATPVGGGVRLAWTPSPEADVAGYVVYRAEGGGPFVRIGTTRAPSAVFADTNVGRGTYRYAVSAQDAAARPNESARSTAVTVTLP